MGVCAGIADYTGFDVTLVRICMLAAMFLSSGSILPFYFIAGWITPTKPRELEYADREEQQVLAGRARLAGPHRARHPFALQGHRPPARRHRKLCDDRKPLARPRNRATALKRPSGSGRNRTCRLWADQYLPWTCVIVAIGSRLGDHHLAPDQARLSAGKDAWGMAIHPKTDREADGADQAADRTRMRSSRRARVDQGPAGKSERIVTDQPSKLAREIDALSIDKGGHA